MADALDGIVDDILSSPAVSTPQENESSFDGGTYAREGYAWAVDAYWVYEHLGDRLNKEKAGNPGRYALWKYAKKETDKFIGQMLPKAMTLLEKARDNTNDDATIVQKEHKAVGELRSLLRKAVAESETISP